MSSAGGRIRIALVVTRFIAGTGGVALRGALALDPDRFEITVLAAQDGNLLDDAAKAGFAVVPLRHMRPQIAPREDVAALREVAGHIEASGYHDDHTHSAKTGMVGRVTARWHRAPAIVHTFHGSPFLACEHPV